MKEDENSDACGQTERNPSHLRIFHFFAEKEKPQKNLFRHTVILCKFFIYIHPVNSKFTKMTTVNIYKMTTVNIYNMTTVNIYNMTIVIL